MNKIEYVLFYTEYEYVGFFFCCSELGSSVVLGKESKQLPSTTTTVG